MELDRRARKLLNRKMVRSCPSVEKKTIFLLIDRINISRTIPMIRNHDLIERINLFRRHCLNIFPSMLRFSASDGRVIHIDSIEIVGCLLTSIDFSLLPRKRRRTINILSSECDSEKRKWFPIEGMNRLSRVLRGRDRPHSTKRAYKRMSSHVSEQSIAERWISLLKCLLYLSMFKSKKSNRTRGRNRRRRRVHPESTWLSVTLHQLYPTSNVQRRERDWSCRLILLLLLLPNTRDRHSLKSTDGLTNSKNETTTTGFVNSSPLH